MFIRQLHSLIAVFYKKTDKYMKIPLLPTIRQIKAYEKVKELSPDEGDVITHVDPDYNIELDLSIDNAYVFTSKTNPSDEFVIIDEDSRRGGKGNTVKKLYRDGIAWNTVKYPYDKISISDLDQRKIHEFYKDANGKGQSVTIYNNINDDRVYSYTYKNVRKNEIQIHNEKYTYYIYLSSNSTDTYVVGIPCKYVKSVEDSFEKTREIVSALL